MNRTRCRLSLMNPLLALLMAALPHGASAYDIPLDGAQLKHTGPIVFTEEARALAGKRIAVLGDSITQAGGYVSFLSCWLEKTHPRLAFDIHPLGLASETLSGLSEDGHAGGAFPRPCLFERLGRVLDRLKPEVVFACYGMNDGIYQPLDDQRFKAFKDGVTRLIKDCRAAGVKELFLITPPIHDAPAKPGEFSYDDVLAAYAAWELTQKAEGVHVIDLHSAMRKARQSRSEPFSGDHVHPGDEGHLFMARTILAALGVQVPDEPPAAIKADPLFVECDRLRRLRADGWMRHIGYTRERTVAPQPLGDTETEAAKTRERIDALRRP